MKPQITVFGATGFIGRHIVRRLAKTGVTIRVPTRDPEKGLLLKPAGDVGQIVPFRCSTRNDADVAAAIGNSYTVINLLGILSEKGRDTFQSVHVEMAARIARLAKDQGVSRYLHMSALGADARSTSRYAKSKAAGEEAVKTFFPETTLLRPSIVFGPEDHFFNRFAAMAKIFPMMPLIGGGKTKFQPVYVGDLAEAVVKILETSQSKSAVYELGGPEVYSFRQVLELIASVTGQKRPFVTVPWTLAKIEAALLEWLPSAPLTRDQVELLKTDNIIQPSLARTFKDLEMTPTAAEVILPLYLQRFMVSSRLKEAAFIKTP